MNSYAFYRMALFPVTLSDPNYPNHPIFDILFVCVSPFSSKWLETETSNLVDKLIVASASQGWQTDLKGAWSCHVNH